MYLGFSYEDDCKLSKKRGCRPRTKGEVMKELFSFDDFLSEGQVYLNEPMADQCADRANRLYRERVLEKGFRVYGTISNGATKHAFSRIQWEGDAHQALLINIEPIAKPKCERHEPLIINDVKITDIVVDGYDTQLNEPFTSITCKHCGVKLEAEWKASE